MTKIRPRPNLAPAGYIAVGDDSIDGVGETEQSALEDAAFACGYTSLRHAKESDATWTVEPATEGLIDHVFNFGGDCRWTRLADGTACTVEEADWATRRT